ncbi:MAG TPA: hypothetical protein VEX39_01415 [Thermoleophilaceae bacterium]|nr:hypothetical protein [Thermoleophilaceae bacterium]
MDLILIIAVVFVLLVALVVLGVGVAASRSRRNDVSRADELVGLSRVKSPSGKSFFPTDDSVLELAELLDDVEERGRRDRER